MNDRERNIAYRRIVSDKIAYSYNRKQYSFVSPSLDDQMAAEEVYESVLSAALNEGVFSEDALFDFLLVNDLWLPEDENDLELIQKDVEVFKTELFHSFFKERERDVYRTNLKDRYGRRNILLNKRHAFDHLSASGIALIARHRFLTGCSIRLPDGKPIWPNPLRDYKRKYGWLVEATLNVLPVRLSESDFRELARNDPFRSVWICKDHSGRGVFDKASVDLTDDQRSLCLWANFYDNINSHPDKPPEEIVEDDDALDGWCIVQRKKQKSEGQKLDLGSAGNHDEVYVPLIKDDGNIDENKAKIIESLNTPQAKYIMAKRKALLDKRGIVNEMDFEDVKMRYEQAVTAAWTQANRG